MEWFWLALIGPILWALTNHIDKFLITRYFADRPTSALVLISSFAGLLVALPAFFFAETIFLPWYLILGFVVIGFLEVLYLFPYFAALHKGEASLVSPLFQLIPIFYFIGAYFLLGETLTGEQVLGCTLLIVGGLLTVVNIRSMHWERDIFFLMLSASALIALSGIIFKWLALDGHFAAAIFWQSLGSFILSVTLLSLKTYRDALKLLIGQSGPILSLNVFNEVITLAGNVAMRYASLLVPITVAQAVGGFQPLFVFFWGAIGVLLLSRFGIEEDLSPLAVLKKISVAVILVLGAWMLR